MRDTLQLLHVRVVDGVGGGAPLAALLLALLGREVTFTRPLGGVDAVLTAETHDLLTRTFRRCFDVPASLVGADKVLFALCADPLASDGVLLETGEVRPARPYVVDMSQGDENGGSCRREVGVIRIRNTQVGRVVHKTASRISGNDWALGTTSIYLNGEEGVEERPPGDTGRSTCTGYCSGKSWRLGVE